MHRMLKPGGAYAEFAVAPAWTTFGIPRGMGFEGVCVYIFLYFPLVFGEVLMSTIWI